MIQGAINQLIGVAAVAKKTHDISVAKEMKAREKAMARARTKVKSKYEQSKAYKNFIQGLGSNQAPEELKRIAFEELQRRNVSPSAMKVMGKIIGG